MRLLPLTEFWISGRKCWSVWKRRRSLGTTTQCLFSRIHDSARVYSFLQRALNNSITLLKLAHSLTVWRQLCMDLVFVRQLLVSVSLPIAKLWKLRIVTSKPCMILKSRNFKRNWSSCATGWVRWPAQRNESNRLIRMYLLLKSSKTKHLGIKKRGESVWNVLHVDVFPNCEYRYLILLLT